MTYIVNGNCIQCKYTDCVAVCPVDCFKEGENFLVIDPDECIDCGVCEPECPADAIVSDHGIEDSPELQFWAKLNQALSGSYKTITVKKPALDDADEHNPKLNPTVGDKRGLLK